MINVLLKERFRIVFIFTMLCIILSCDHKEDENKCYKLNYQSLIHLGSKTLIDSAIYYNQKAIECNPSSKIILSTRYSIYKQKKDVNEMLNSLNGLIELKDSIKENDKDWYRFEKTILFIALNEKEYSDSIKKNYNFLNKKFNFFKKTAINREDFHGTFEQKVLYDYYLNGKSEALELIELYPTVYNFSVINDYVYHNVNPKTALFGYVDMSWLEKINNNNNN